MIDRWSKKIEAVTTDFITSFGGLNFQQINQKPDSNTWSIGQIINHLIITNESYYPVIESVQQGSYKIPLIGKIGFMVDFLGNFVLKTVQPDAKRKSKTFKIWEPSSSDIREDIIERFKNHQSDLKKVISGSDDLLERKTVISSPVNRNFVYKLETAFDILVAHEQRHYNQAERLLSNFNFKQDWK